MFTYASRYTHTHTHTPTPTLTGSLARTHPCSYTYSSHTQPHLHTYVRMLTDTYTCSYICAHNAHTLTQGSHNMHSHTLHTCIYTYTRLQYSCLDICTRGYSYILACSHADTLIDTHAHALTHTVTHTQTHAYVRVCTYSRVYTHALANTPPFRHLPLVGMPRAEVRGEPSRGTFGKGVLGEAKLGPGIRKRGVGRSLQAPAGDQDGDG